MISVKHKKAIFAVVIAVVLGCLYLDIDKGYDICIDNGNSVAQCTGRG